MQDERYDIAIIGAGMVGATLACCFGGGGLRVVLVESSAPVLDWPEDSMDLRVSALSAASQQIFSRLGAWEKMVRLGVSPFSQMQVWDASGPGRIHFDSADIGEPRLGHIVENRVIQRALIERLRECGNIVLRCPAELSALTTGDDAVRVGLADGTTLQAALVVGADGGNSQVRTLAGIETRGWDYDQRALVATVATELPHQTTAWQRFLPQGPLALLPLRDGRCSIVWSTSPAHADQLLHVGDAVFMEQLAAAFEYRLGRITAVSGRAAFPLRLQHAHAYIAPRLALVGDAAHTIHPLAGQGVNLGLLDAAALAEVVLAAAGSGADIGARRVLRRFERWRKGDNLLMMAVMDAFKRIFGSGLPPLRLARNIGLSAANAAGPLKHLIIRHAMGLAGDLPRLARQPHL